MSYEYFEIREECPACSSINPREIFSIAFDEPSIKDYLTSFYTSQGQLDFEYLKDSSYTLLECDGCGLIFQRNIPTAILAERIYEHWIDPKKALAKARKKELGDYARFAKEIMQVIASFNKNPSSLDFLDFGMGWGQWAIMARAFGVNSYGTEVSKERILNARSSGIEILAPAEIASHQFDYINTEQVFEHLAAPLATLRSLCNSLKPDGIIKISVPSATNIDERLKKMDWSAPKGTRLSLNPVAPLEHINFFRRKSINKMAEIAGLEEFLIPMKIQYQFLTLGMGVKGMVKNLLSPLYNYFKGQNCIFFKKSAECC